MTTTDIPSVPPEGNASWDEARLNKLIQDGIEESHNVEYKAAAALGTADRQKLDITKDVSAMANSAGGVVIYGIAEFADATKKHLPARIDPVNRSQFSKEWLENVISSIQPRIAGVTIHVVNLSSAKNHGVYVVEIPQADTAHQAKDFRYYRRYNFKLEPMLDHEVRDVMNRRGHPRVKIGAEFVVYPRLDREGDSGHLVVGITNESDVLAQRVLFIVFAPLRVRGKLIAYKEGILVDRPEGRASKLLYSNHNAAPLFPRGMLHEIFKFKFAKSMTVEPQYALGEFQWHAYADAMPMQKGSFSVDEIYSVQK